MEEVTAVETYQTLAQKPDVWNFFGQVPERPGKLEDGLCDTNAGITKQAAEPWRYATAQLTMTHTGTNWVAAASTEFTLLDKGEGQEMPNATNVDLTGSETDLNKDGGMAKGADNVWVIQSLGAQFVQPYAQSGDPSVKLYTAAIDNLAARVQKAWYDNAFMELDYQDEDCPRTMGLAKFWPQHASTHGNEIVTNSASIGQANAMPLRRPFMSGSAKGDYAASMKIKTNQEFRVEDDPAFPVPDAITEIVIPLQILLYGRPGCNTRCVPVCVRPDGSMFTKQLNGGM
jgi:hypothetical protein